MAEAFEDLQRLSGGSLSDGMYRGMFALGALDERWAYFELVDGVINEPD